MKLRKPFAGISVAAVAATGLVMGAGTAQAEPVPAPEPVYVPGASIVPTSSPEEETASYNVWHFDPSHGQDVAQARNGIVFGQGTTTLPLKGNGNDGEAPVDATSILALASSLGVVSSDDSAIAFQVPVRIDTNGDGTWQQGEGWTTLRANAANPQGNWTTSKAIGGYGDNASAPLADLVEALGENAYPIGAGFQVPKAKSDVLVSSFTANGEQTKFYAEPAIAGPGAPSSEYVTDAQIRPNEDTYAGWHEGAAAGGSYETVAGENGATTGLKITGKAQILNGFAEDAYLANGLAKAAVMQVGVAADSDAVWVQVPVFAYPEGRIDAPVFTTIRAQVPASGNLIDATAWVSSKAVGDVAANTPASLDEILTALGDHDVIGYGVFVDSGKTATVESIAFDGRTTSFAKAADPVDPPAQTPFPDVPKGAKFEKEINWMLEQGLTTGIKKTDADGNVYYAYEPKFSVTREAMAAFLFRLEAPKNYQAPSVSPFADVKPGDKFYKEITWMHQAKLSTGIKQPSGKPNFAPKAKITREAIAAFMFRKDADRSYQAPKASPFADVKPGQKFYKEMAWMKDAGLSTGIKQPSGKPIYAPKWNVTREAMAAFFYRGESR